MIVGISAASRSSPTSPYRKRRKLLSRAAETMIFLRAYTSHVDRSCPDDRRDDGALRAQTHPLRPRSPRPSPTFRAIHTDLRIPVQHSIYYITACMNIEEFRCLCPSYIPIPHVLLKNPRPQRTDRHAGRPGARGVQKSSKLGPGSYYPKNGAIYHIEEILSSMLPYGRPFGASKIKTSVLRRTWCSCPDPCTNKKKRRKRAREAETAILPKKAN